MRKLLAIFLIVPLCSASQTEIHTGGTIILAAKGSDGIMLAADSRNSMFDYDSMGKQKVFYGYFDRAPKIFPLRKFAISFAITPFINGVTIGRVVKEFDSANISYGDPFELIDKLARFAQRNYPFYLPEMIRGIMIAVGYKDTAHIAVSMFGDFMKPNFGWSSTSQYEIDSLNAFKYSKYLSCAELYERAYSAIQKVIVAFHREHDIGGEIVAIKIDSNNKIIWLTPNHSINYDTYCNIVKMYFNGTLGFTYLKPEYKRKIDSTMNLRKNKYCR